MSEQQQEPADAQMHAPEPAPADPEVLPAPPPPPPVWPPEFAANNPWSQLQPQPRRSLLASTICIAGALLWAYLVMGELVVSANFPEAFAVLIVLGALGLNWHSSAKLTSDTRSSRLQLLLPGMLGIGMYLLVLILTTAILGSSNRSAIAALTVMLLFFAIVAYGVGRYLKRGSGSPRTLRQRAVSVALWVVSGFTTLIALSSALRRV